MRRILILALILWIALGMVITAFADVVCVHAFFVDSRTTYQPEFTITRQEHGYRTYLYETCLKCETTRTTIISSEMIAHTFLFEKDLGHRYPTNYHDYRYQCTDGRCNYQKIISNYCDGTCRTTLKKPIIQEEN